MCNCEREQTLILRERPHSIKLILFFSHHARLMPGAQSLMEVQF